MLTAIVVYIAVGLAVGAIARFTKSESSSLAGMIGSGGAAGFLGGVASNLIFSDEIAVDAAGLAGSIVLAIVAVLAVRSADRRQAAETQSAAESAESAETDEPAQTDDEGTDD